MDLGRTSRKLFIANFGAAIIGFLGLSYFSQNLGPSIMGSFFLFQTTVGFISILSDFGIRKSVEKKIIEDGGIRRVVSSGLLLKGIGYLSVTIIVFFSRKTLNNYIGGDVYIIVILAVGLREFYLLLQSILNGSLRVAETASAKFLQRLSFLVFGLILLPLTSGLNTLLFALLFSYIAPSILLLNKLEYDTTASSIYPLSDMVGYAKDIFISRLGSYTYNWADVLIVGALLSYSDVGIYEVAWRVTTIVILFSNSVSTVVFPKVSDFSTSDSNKELNRSLEDAIVLSLLVVIPSFFGSLIIGEQLLALLFGPEFSAGWLILVILLGEKVIQGFHAVLGQALQALDKPGLAARATILSVIINIILNVVLIGAFGLVGAAIATLVSFSINTLLHMHFVSRIIGLKLPRERLFYLLVTSLIMVFALKAILSNYEITNIQSLVIIIFTGAMVYFSTLLLTPVKKDLYNLANIK